MLSMPDYGVLRVEDPQDTPDLFTATWGYPKDTALTIAVCDYEHTYVLHRDQFAVIFPIFFPHVC